MKNKTIRSFAVRVPDDLHMEFKLHTVKNRLSMNAEIVRMIQAYMNNGGKICTCEVAGQEDPVEKIINDEMQELEAAADAPLREEMALESEPRKSVPDTEDPSKNPELPFDKLKIVEPVGAVAEVKKARKKRGKPSKAKMDKAHAHIRTEVEAAIGAGKEKMPWTAIAGELNGMKLKAPSGSKWGPRNVKDEWDKIKTPL